MSKGASMSRLITEEYVNLARRGYDGLLVGTGTPYTIDAANTPGWAPTRLDAHGRTIALGGTVRRACGAVPALAGVAAGAPPSMEAPSARPSAPSSVEVQVPDPAGPGSGAGGGNENAGES